jgi:hypothetical protein
MMITNRYQALIQPPPKVLYCNGIVGDNMNKSIFLLFFLYYCSTNTSSTILGSEFAGFGIYCQKSFVLSAHI